MGERGRTWGNVGEGGGRLLRVGKGERSEKVVGRIEKVGEQERKGVRR